MHWIFPECKNCVNSERTVHTWFETFPELFMISPIAMPLVAFESLILCLYQSAFVAVRNMMQTTGCFIIYCSEVILKYVPFYYTCISFHFSFIHLRALHWFHKSTCINISKFYSPLFSLLSFKLTFTFVIKKIVVSDKADNQRHRETFWQNINTFLVHNF